MDIKSSLTAGAAFYTGSILVDPCPPVLPIPALLLLAAGAAVKSLLPSKKKAASK